MDLIFEAVKKALDSNNVNLTPVQVSKVVYVDAVENRYANAELNFAYLAVSLRKKTAQRTHKYFSSLEVFSIQKGYAALIRHAPDNNTASKKFAFFYIHFDEPFATDAFDLVLMSNLIHRFTRNPDHKKMKDALGMVRKAVEADFFELQVDPAIVQNNRVFGEPKEVLVVVYTKELNYHNLNLMAIGALFQNKKTHIFHIFKNDLYLHK